jgi:hypothetical protein
MDLSDELRGNSLFGSGREQAVIICLQFPIGKLQEKKARDALFDLGNIFREVIESSGVGTYNGYEFSNGEEQESVTFYIYGEDASRIYREIKPILYSLPSLSELYIIKRFSSFLEEHFPLS